MLRGWTDGIGRRAMGLERLELGEGGTGERQVVDRANAILGF